MSDDRAQIASRFASGQQDADEYMTFLGEDLWPQLGSESPTIG